MKTLGIRRTLDSYVFSMNQNPRVTCKFSKWRYHVFSPLLFPLQFAPNPEMRGKKRILFNHNSNKALRVGKGDGGYKKDKNAPNID